MPEIDFSKVNDAQDFTPVPEGEYLCQIMDVKEETTNNGNPVWKLELEIQAEDYAGKKVFDNLIFTEKAFNRVKKLYSACGYAVDKKHNCEPADILGQHVTADVIIENYTDKNGNEKKINKVSFAGYEPAGLIGEDEIPF